MVCCCRSKLSFFKRQEKASENGFIPPGSLLDIKYFVKSQYRNLS